MTNLTEEQIKRCEMATEIMNEVVSELGIEDVPDEFDLSNYDGSHLVFKSVINNDIRIYVFTEGVLGLIEVGFSLTIVTHTILAPIEALFKPSIEESILHKAISGQLKSKEIDILKLFDITESEIDDEIKSISKGILKLFFKNVILFSKATLGDAVANSLSGYILHTIKDIYRDYWQELGLPKNFNLERLRNQCKVGC